MRLTSVILSNMVYMSVRLLIALICRSLGLLSCLVVCKTRLSCFVNSDLLAIFIATQFCPVLAEVLL